MLTGLILTNTKLLASKLSSDQKSVISAISSYVSSCSSYINWQTVDMGDSMYKDLNKSNWTMCASVLSDYYVGLGLQDRSYCPLFIIGGDDIVPMPRVANPLDASGGEYLASDMLYCFDMSTPRLDNLVSQKPRFAVGRLPLTKEWNLAALESYLDDCVGYAANGFPVRGAAMTTTQSWVRASTEIMKDIPTVALSTDYVPLNNRMIVSPDLDTRYEEDYNGYVHELKKVDFLVCNLHGHYDQGTPFFMGEDNSCSKYTVATQPSMLEKTPFYIFNTVACYGGRYIDYKLDESMVLTALAYGTMLYCGACDTAYGGAPNNDASCSELMMRLYNIYLHKGMPAGLALIKAKQDYYRTCHNEDSDNYAMYTILEFNLFGCPILSMQPKLSADYEPRLLGQPIIKNAHTSYRPKTMEVVFGGAHKAENIHSYVRGLVDNNLAEIRQKVETEVYQRLGLGESNVQQIMRVSQDNHTIGYQFIYAWSPEQSYRNFQMYYIVDTDTNGNISKMMQTK